MVGPGYVSAAVAVTAVGATTLAAILMLPNHRQGLIIACTSCAGAAAAAATFFFGGRKEITNLKKDFATSADRTWARLKHFSLLSVSRNSERSDRRTASMHRLLQELVRKLPGKKKKIALCAHALDAVWTFDPRDTVTWGGTSGLIVEHILALGRHAYREMKSVDRQTFIKLRNCSLARAYISPWCSPIFKRRTPLWACDEANYKQDDDKRHASRGMVARVRMRFDEARQLLNDALTIDRAGGNAEALASTLHELGVLHIKQRNFAKAESLLREALAIKNQQGLQGKRFDISPTRLPHSISSPSSA